jgi:microcystin-dependent protein
MKIRVIITALIVCSVTSLCLGQVGINNPNPDPSAALDLTAVDKGLLIPRLTTAQREAISSPGRSLLVFDSTDGKFYFYDGGQWYALNELVRIAGSNDVSLPSGNLSIGGNITSSGSLSSGSLSVSGFANNALVPSGSIVMWSGLITTIPSGWALCDGTNGTPDLRERFIVGAGLTDNTVVTGTPAYSPGPGGNTFNSITLTANESGLRLHTHTVTDPRHSHGIANGREFAIWISNEANAGSGSSGNEVSDSAHPPTTDLAATGITINSVASSNAIQAHENRPPFYALAFIMKL